MTCVREDVLPILPTHIQLKKVGFIVKGAEKAELAVVGTTKVQRGLPGGIKSAPTHVVVVKSLSQPVILGLDYGRQHSLEWKMTPSGIDRLTWLDYRGQRYPVQELEPADVTTAALQIGEESSRQAQDPRQGTMKSVRVERYDEDRGQESQEVL